MASVPVTFSADENRIREAILRGAAKALDGALRKSLPEVRLILKSHIRAAVSSCPEYLSLTSGGLLQAHLGVVDAEPALRKVIENICKNLLVESLGAEASGSTISGGLRASFLMSDMSETDVSQGRYETEKNATIPWMHWFTEEGSRVLVRDFAFSPISGGHHSRTGLGVMRYSPGDGWTVPDAFSGTVGNNWLTRAFSAIPPSVAAAIAAAVQRSI